MNLYPSGTPCNDLYQAIENQMCSHRLFSMFADYQSGVMKWLEMVKSGVRTFDDYVEYTPGLDSRLSHEDRLMSQRIRERGETEKWQPYSETLRQISASHPATVLAISCSIPEHSLRGIEGRSALDGLTRAYEAFLKQELTSYLTKSG